MIDSQVFWVLAYIAKAVRGEMSSDCASFAYKAKAHFEHMQRDDDEDESAQGS